MSTHAKVLAFICRALSLCLSNARQLNRIAFERASKKIELGPRSGTKHRTSVRPPSRQLTETVLNEFDDNTLAENAITPSQGSSDRRTQLLAHNAEVDFDNSDEDGVELVIEG
jgi:hypothetical protein